MSVSSPASHSRFAGIVGPTCVVTEASSLAQYAIAGANPAVVLRPESVEQIPEIIKFAASEKLALVVTGGRTKLEMGLPPERYDVALDMSALNKIISYDPADLTLSVEAGIPLLHLAKALGKHGQFLPLAVPFLERTTIGGIIASGADGPLRQFYGTARDYLLGIEFVTGDGVASKSGGRVVKNVTGYDIHKLMIGALGTLGVIARLNFKTFPLPTATRGFVARFPSATQACEMRNRIATSPLTPLTLDILSPRVAELFASEVPPSTFEPEPMPPDILSSAEWTVTTGYCGNEKILARYETDLRRIAADSGATGLTHTRRESRPSLGPQTRIYSHRSRLIAGHDHRQIERVARAYEGRPRRCASGSRNKFAALGRTRQRRRRYLFRASAVRPKSRRVRPGSKNHRRHAAGRRENRRQLHDPVVPCGLEKGSPHLGTGSAQRLANAKTQKRLRPAKRPQSGPIRRRHLA